MKISNIFLRAIFSYKFVLIMMTLLALGAGIATFLESRYDTQTARILVYGALWYEIVLGLLALSLVGIIIKTHMYKRVGAFLLHLSFIVIILGSFITRYWGYEGVVHVKVGQTQKDMMSVKPYFTIEAGKATHVYELALSQLGDNSFKYSVEVEGKPLEIKYNKFEKGQRGKFDTLFVEVRYGNDERIIKIEGGAGWIEPPVSFKIDNIEIGLAWGSKYVSLPFSLRLDKFTLERYAGSNTPSSFASDVHVSDLSNNPINHRISMNQPLTYKGYKIFQSSYDRDEQGTMFEVNKDPGKIPTYVGYFLLCVGFIANFFTKGSRFLYLCKFLNKTTLSLVLLGFLSYPTHSNADDLKQFAQNSRVHVDNNFSTLLVQDLQGRIKPLSTEAREIVSKITSSDNFLGLSPEQMVLAMNINAPKWREMQIIKVVNPDIKNLLAIEQTQQYISFASVFDKNGDYILDEAVNKANQTSPSKRGKLENDLIKLDEKLNIAYLTMRGILLRFIPVEGELNERWLSPNEAFASAKVSSDVKDKLSSYLTGVNEGVLSNNWKIADESLEFLKANQRKHSSEILPSSLHVEAEVIYNKINIFKRLISFYLIIGLGAFAVAMVGIFANRDFHSVKKTIFYMTVIGFVLHSAGLALRWYISGHAPWSDSYESLVYVAWSAIFAGILLFRNSLLSLSSACILAGLMMFVAHMSFMNPQITNLVPVLKSYWLIVHVSVITASYGFLGLGALLGFMILLLMSFKTQSSHLRVNEQIRRLVAILEVSLIVGICLLTIGNFFGGIWANESWGRYWGWDPKETWSFVSIVVYAIVLHLRFVKKLDSVYILATASMFAYGSILMTYFGVNFYLTGLHSYGVTGYVPALPNYVYYTVGALILLSIVAYRGREVKSV